MNKAKLIAVAVILSTSISAFAGGLLTNTNQSVHFLRNPARDASTEIDAVYTNPAGTVMLSDGLHFSVNNQSAFQTRTITSTSPLFMMNGGSDTKSFKGKASAPIIPSVQGVYHKDKWALSGSFAVGGGGGKATFDHGLPSFEAMMGGSVAVLNAISGATNGATQKANQYSLEQHMKGSNFIYAAQLGGAYQINKMFSAYAGFRLNIVYNKYEGYLRDLKMNLTDGTSNDYSSTMVSAAPQLQQIYVNSSKYGLNATQQQVVGLAALASNGDGVVLNSSQSGWGVAPILGVNFNYENKLNIGVKYEFKTALDVENNTKRDDTGMFADGVNTAYDIPALLTIGASYKIIPALTASVGYHHFFDSHAKMQSDKHKNAGSTNEYLFGLEYQIDKMFLVSAGTQITRYGINDAYQSDLSFACNSYSIGLGGAVNVSPTVKINIGYFWTNYSDYTKEPGVGTSKDVFSRTNKVFGAGVDFSF